VGMINALKGCEGIKIVVIFDRNSVMAERSSGVMRVSNTIADLFTQLKPILPGLIILFNKF